MGSNRAMRAQAVAKGVKWASTHTQRSTCGYACISAHQQSPKDAVGREQHRLKHIPLPHLPYTLRHEAVRHNCVGYGTCRSWVICGGSPAHRVFLCRAAKAVATVASVARTPEPSNGARVSSAVSWSIATTAWAAGAFSICILTFLWGTF